MEPKYKFKTKPFEHQLDCWERNKREKWYAYLMEMGTGKTKILIDTVAYMYDQGWINSVMIFANKGSYANWMTEIPIHMPEHIEYKAALWKSPQTVAFKNELNALAEPGLFMKIFVMNIEALVSKKAVDIAKKFVMAGQAMVVVDESSTIKNQKAGRTKAVKIIGKHAVARRIMTGSPVDNRPLDIYSQFDFLCRGLIGHTSYYSFREEYAQLIEMTTKHSPRPFKTVVGYKNLDRLNAALSKNSFIIKKADCLDLPSKLYETSYVELTSEQVRLYESLKKDCFAELEGALVSVTMALTKLLRLHQLVCGHLVDDDKIGHEVPCNRLKVLSNIIEESQGKVIIWANYRHDIKAIEAYLKKEYGNESTLSYYGDTKQEDRDYVKKIFKRGGEVPEVRFLVANQQTAGYGLTLTAANTVIYYSNNFNAEHRNQSEDRCHRIGQTDKVTYIDLVCKSTIDEYILKVLKGKKSLADLITPSNWKEFI